MSAVRLNDYSGHIMSYAGHCVSYAYQVCCLAAVSAHECKQRTKSSQQPPSYPSAMSATACKLMTCHLCNDIKSDSCDSGSCGRDSCDSDSCGRDSCGRDSSESGNCDRDSCDTDSCDPDSDTWYAAMVYLEVRVKDLALQRLLLPIGRHLSSPHIGPFKGLEGSVIGLKLFGKQRQEFRHVNAAKSALACKGGLQCC